jgi:hypothetical protein
MRFQVHRHTVRLKHCVKSGDDLFPQPFLDCEALGKQANQARQFGDADDVLVWDIPDVHMPVKRECMMLTQRKKRDRPFDAADPLPNDCSDHPSCGQTRRFLPGS